MKINFCNFGSTYHKDYFKVIYLVINFKDTKNSPYFYDKIYFSYIELKFWDEGVKFATIAV